MARRLKKKVKRFLLVFLVLPLVIIGIFVFGTPKSPEPELNKARVAIAQARKTIEKDFIPPSLTEAESLYDSAMRIWRSENQRFILRRDYSKPKTLAIRAEQQAIVSPKIASQNTTDFLALLENTTLIIASFSAKSSFISCLISLISPLTCVSNKLNFVSISIELYLLCILSIERHS